MRRLPGALLVLVALTTVTGFAASLGGLTSDRLGAGDDVVAACDGNGFTSSYTTSAGNVTGVTLGGIADPGCDGASVSVVLAGAGGVSLGSAGPQTIAADGDSTDGSLALSLAPLPLASAVTRLHVVVVGP